MELKDFIKNVVSDVTNAIKECQEELDNGAIVSPTNRKANEKINDDSKISYIDFEVGIATEENSEMKAKISVFSVVTGNIQGGYSSNNGNVSKIRFSIPVVYPTIKVKKPEESTSKKVKKESYWDKD